jgi:uncharacterized protein (TIGR04255 family)
LTIPFDIIHASVRYNEMNSSYLKPISNEHSIKEAVFCLFLNSSIPNPSRFKTLLNSELREFQNFQPTSRYDFKMDLSTKGSNIKTIPDVGFEISHSENGDKIFVIRGQNEDIRNYFSFHILKYEEWKNFRNKILNYIKVLANFQPGLQIVAFSLLYIDEFDWEPESLKLETVFNSNSRILPRDFLTSQNSNLSTTLQKESNSFEYQDRIDLNVSTINRKIVISNNLIKNLDKEIDLIEFTDENKSIIEQINFFHKFNKENLKDLLSEDVTKLIGLIK